MSVSGNEETGVIGWQSGNSSAGIPIKKRKFPSVRPPSPPLWEPVKNDLMKNRSSRESSLPNDGVGTSSLGESDERENLVFEIKKELPADTNANLVGFNVDIPMGKHQSSKLTVLSDCLEAVDLKKKLLQSSHQKMTKLDLALNEAPAMHVKKEVPNELSGMEGTVKLSLGPTEPLGPALVACQSSDGQVNDKLDPSSLCLSLSQDESEGGCKSDVKVNNRSNWDLNATMDSWEGPVGDGAGPEMVDVSGLKKSGGINGAESLESSIAVLGALTDSGEHFLGATDRISKCSTLSLTPSGQYRSEDSLHLSLGASYAQPTFSGEQSTSSAKVDSGQVLPSSNLVEGLVSTGNASYVGFNIIKSEPFDENAKHDFLGARVGAMGVSDLVDRDLVERCCIKAVNSSNFSPEEPVKSVPLQEGNQKTQVMSQNSVENVADCQSTVSSALSMAVVPDKSYPPGLHNLSEFSMSRDAPHQLEYSTCREQVSIDTNTTQGTCKIIDQAANGDDPETWRLETMDYVPLSSHAGNEEKINVSADILEEDSYGSNYESDGNHDIVVRVNLEGGHDNREDDKYEDSEVRKALPHAATEVPMEDGEEKKIIQDDSDGKLLETLDFTGDGITPRICRENDDKVENHGDIGNDRIKECVDAIINKTDQESSTVEGAAVTDDEKRPIKSLPKRPLDLSRNGDVEKGHDTEELSDGTSNGSQGVETTVSQSTNVNIEGTSTVEKDHPTSPKTESSLNDKDAAKGSNNGGSRSRIINLSRGSNTESPSKLRCIGDRPLLSTTRRERYTDFQGEKEHIQRKRDKFYPDSPHRFDRDRFEEQPFRNSRMNFVCGRGRGFRQRGEWKFDGDLDGEIYNGTGDYQSDRHKRAFARGDAELEGNGYGCGMASNRALGMNRGGRKPMNNELPSFYHPYSRHLSPRVGDGPGTRNIQMVQTFSPSRRTREDSSDLVGPRHGEKFMRGMPEDVIDPIYQGSDGLFARGNMNFSTVRRRGFCQTGSKSPVRCRTRSPGPWSSPRTRSPDGFSGRPEFAYRRSPNRYRRDRIISPDHPCFSEERVARRHGSPPYMARTLNMDSERVGPLRSAYPNRRSPSEHIFPRNARRHDIIDSRVRTDNDEYFGGPIRSGRFHDGGDKRNSGRFGHGRSFRPTFNGAGSENLHFHQDGRSRPLRFCSDFIERGNLTEREFDSRARNRPGIAPSRIRSLEEEEGKCRHGGQAEYDDGFDDISQLKRRRF